MPVDHPATAPEAVRRTYGRTLTVGLSFFVTLAVLLVLGPLLRIGSIMS